MAWVPIAQSGIDCQFLAIGGADLDFSASVVSSSSQIFAGWQLDLGDGSVDYSVRVTVLSYSSVASFGEPVSRFEIAPVGGDPVVTLNENEGDSDSFAPNPVLGSGHQIQYLTGVGAETSREESYSMLVEVEADQPDTCKELGRVTRANASAYDRARIHQFRLYATEKRCLVANFNGALPVGRTIARAEWRMEVVSAVAMSSPAISGREARVMIEACYWGDVAIRCAVTLDNGEVYNQLFAGRVLDGPYFGTEFTAAGPAVLVVDA